MGERGVSGCVDEDAQSARHTSISVIVACYSLDRLNDLFALLQSIELQTEPIDELIVVVQRSRELLDALQPALGRLQHCRVVVRFLAEAAGVSLARNAGVAEASCDVVAFVDDDAVLMSDWAAATRAFYERWPDAIGAAGAILPLWDSPTMAWFPRELYWMVSCTYWTATSPTPVRNGYGANMSFRREAFDNGRRFDETIGIGGWGVSGWKGMGGEEPVLSLRVASETGRPILYAPDIRAGHRVKAYRLGLKNLARRAYWEGRLKAVLSGMSTGGPPALDMERSLLRQMVRIAAARLGRFPRQPITAVRQQGVVLLLVGVVALGFAVGVVRRDRR